MTSIQEIAEASPAVATSIIDLDEAIQDAKQDKPKYEGIAVCGSHPATVEQAPFDDPSWLIYACSPDNLDWASANGPVQGAEYERRHLMGGVRPDGGRYRVDEWFEIHLPLADRTRSYEYLKEVERLPLVWMRDPSGLQRIKGARPYPEQEMKQRFGPFFFTSSIAFMFAKAIADCERLGIDRIALFGIMQASETEYYQQRPGLQYFITKATEAGIRVAAPQEAKHLFDAPPENF